MPDPGKAAGSVSPGVSRQRAAKRSGDSCDARRSALVRALAALADDLRDAWQRLANDLEGAAKFGVRGK